MGARPSLPGTPATVLLTLPTGDSAGSPCPYRAILKLSAHPTELGRQ